MNDVVLAVCTGALRGFLLDGDELPDKPLVAVVPVSVRPDIGAPTGLQPGVDDVRPPPGQLDGPLDRLLAIHEGTLGAKEEHNALGADILRQLGRARHPQLLRQRRPALLAMRLANRHRPIANLVISNVPGPDFPLYLGGAELKAGFPLGPVMDGMGVNITVMSYRGILYWGIMACPDNIPGLWDLTAAIPPALDELLEAAGERRPPSGPRMRPRPSGHRAAGQTARGRAPPPLHSTAPPLHLHSTPHCTSDSSPASTHGPGCWTGRSGRATAIDDAPLHTPMARPNVRGAGS